MRTVIYSMSVSLDGYIAGPDGDISWTAPDQELFSFHVQRTREIDAELMGVPAAITKPAILGSAVEGQTLTVVQGTWTNAPTSVTDEWGRCQSTGAIETCHTIATAPSYTLTTADVGATIRIREKASNAFGEGAPSFSRPTAVVAASAQGGLPPSGAPASAIGLGSGVLSSTARATTTTQLKALLAPYPSDEMICWPVSARVGNVKNNDPSLIEPVTPS